MSVCRIEKGETTAGSEKEDNQGHQDTAKISRNKDNLQKKIKQKALRFTKKPSTSRYCQYRQDNKKNL